jgi:peptidoglycan hydrolase-like protein with peptidoglycan-binding domain
LGTKGILAGLAIFAGTWLACGAVTTPSKATPTTKKKTAKKRSGTSKTAAKSTSKSRAVAGKKTAKKASPPRQLAPTKERYQQIQQALAAKGYYMTEPNGVWGADSMDALKHFQADQNLPPDGKLTSLSLIALGLGPKRLSAQSPPPPVHTSQQQ